MKHFLTLLLCVGLAAQSTQAQNLYFPPLAGNTWDTISPTSLGWCADEIDSLYQFLDQTNTKGFIVLKDGRMVLERYFGTFTRDSLHVWNSAGKTITAFLTGVAQEEGLLDINQPTNDLLNVGWTNCLPAAEDQITVWNQLTMTTGIDYNVPDLFCTDPACLNCLNPPGTQWFYHNAPYTLLGDVIANASGLSENQFTTSRLRSKIGMNGLWVPVGYNRVYVSNARSMARFGLMIQNRGVWNTDTLMRDTAYFRQMVTPSQNLNRAYGYLWWLNGQSSYILPGLTFALPGAITPDGPADMISALGKDGQMLDVVPSMGLVVVRMGDNPDISLVPIVYHNDLWEKLAAVFCGTQVGIEETEENQSTNFHFFPNPNHGNLTITWPTDLALDPESTLLECRDALGQLLWTVPGTPSSVSLEALAPGLYWLSVRQEGKLLHTQKVIRQ